MGYVGSVDLWYLFDEVLFCFKILKSFIKRSRIYIVNKDNHDFIIKKLNQHNIQSKDYILESLDSEKIPGAIKQMDIGVFFIKPLYSKIASTPTKFAEFLGCGIPCLVNSGIGDLENIISSRRIGVVINEFDIQSISKGLKELLLLKNDNTLKDRCFNAAIEIFDINEAVESYKSIYEKLLKN
jgi:glycosyltransferase involved in cell wall biosynthesis